MESLSTYGLIELDVTEQVAVSGGEWVKGPDDIWTWIADHLVEPLKFGVLDREAP